MKRDQTYQVCSRSAVTVEFSNGNVVSYPSGFMFQAHPSNSSVVRLLRSNLVRKVSPREIPNFNVDTKSHLKAAKAPPPARSPLQVTVGSKKKKSR